MSSSSSSTAPTLSTAATGAAAYQPVVDFVIRTFSTQFLMKEWQGLPGGVDNPSLKARHLNVCAERISITCAARTRFSSTSEEFRALLDTRIERIIDLANQNSPDLPKEKAAFLENLNTLLALNNHEFRKPYFPKQWKELRRVAPELFREICNIIFRLVPARAGDPTHKLMEEAITLFRRHGDQIPPQALLGLTGLVSDEQSVLLFFDLFLEDLASKHLQMVLEGLIAKDQPRPKIEEAWQLKVLLFRLLQVLQPEQGKVLLGICQRKHVKPEENSIREVLAELVLAICWCKHFPSEHNGPELLERALAKTLQWIEKCPPPGNGPPWQPLMECLGIALLFLELSSEKSATIAEKIYGLYKKFEEFGVIDDIPPIKDAKKCLVGVLFLTGSAICESTAAEFGFDLDTLTSDMQLLASVPPHVALSIQKVAQLVTRAPVFIGLPIALEALKRCPYPAVLADFKGRFEAIPASADDTPD